MQITQHFSLSEFERSKTAQTYNIVNRVPEALMPNLKALCLNVLEPLRAHVKEPVEISSGYRCPALNAKVKGVKNSQHMRGEACDIRHKNKNTLKKWFLWMMDNLAFDQLIWERRGYTTWIHVSYCANPKKNRQVVKFI